MNTLEALQARRSCRGFADKPVEEDKLKTVLKYANIAPKSGNFHMTVITRKGLLDNIDENLVNYMKDNPAMAPMTEIPGFKALYNAPVLVFFSVPEEVGNSGVSADLAAENMCIAAAELGLGSCYMMTPVMCQTINPMFKDIIMVPNGMEPYCAVVLGYEGEAIIPAQPRVESDDNINYVG